MEVIGQLSHGSSWPEEESCRGRTYHVRGISWGVPGGDTMGVGSWCGHRKMG